MRVIVVGAGLIGLATAWRLRQDGRDVVLVDPDPVSGATHAAGGMLTPVGEAYHGEDDLTALLLESARRYPGFVANLADHLPDGVSTGYLTRGTLICGVDAADRGHLADLHALCVRLGLRTEEVTTREARRLEPLLGPRLTCAFLAPDDHQVDPRVLASALLVAVRRAGVRLVHEAVTTVMAGDVPTIALATGETLSADVIVIANGLAAARLQGDLGLDLEPLLRPVHGEVARLIAPPHLARLLTRTVRGVVEGRPVYLIPRGDGRLVLGATSREDNLDRVSAGGLHDLLTDAIRLMPAIRELAVEDTVARARPGTPDNAPLIGETAPGIILANGLFRHGILLAPLTADIVAALIRAHNGPPNTEDAALLDMAGTADPRRFATTTRKDTP